MRLLLEHWREKLVLLLNEKNLKDLKSGSTSNLTQKYIDSRFANGRTKIFLKSATINSKKGFMELIFNAASTYGATDYIAATNLQQAADGYYTLAIRFYNIGQYITKDFMSLPSGTKQQAIKQVINNCELKLYSDDPSYYYQGCWEDSEKEGLAIYKFPGEAGKNIWHDRHAKSGGLTNSNIHLTKHLSQLIDNIDRYVSDIARKCKLI